MSDRAAMLRSVMASPGDDLPRLIYADWLDDRGESERAEFIRVQCEIASRWKPTASNDHMLDPEWMSLRECECRLLRRYRGLWLLQTFVVGGELRFDGDVQELCIGSGCLPGCRFRRGFVEEIECSWVEWLRGADAIQRLTPLRRVQLTDAPPVGVMRDRINKVSHFCLHWMSDRNATVAFTDADLDNRGGVDPEFMRQVTIDLLAVLFAGLTFDIPLLPGMTFAIPLQSAGIFFGEPF